MDKKLLFRILRDSFDKEKSKHRSDKIVEICYELQLRGREEMLKDHINTVYNE